MRYRVCKAFEIESGHMLSKHPGRCRFPHGHSRRVEVVVSAETLDSNDMVCDFKAIRLALEPYLDAFDHAMAINADDPALPALRDAMAAHERPGSQPRIIVFEGEDPTTEVLARRIYERLRDAVASGEPLADTEGNTYTLPNGLLIERVRVGETSTSWAEFGM